MNVNLPNLDRRLAILRLSLLVSEASASYNQFSLPAEHKHDITMCSFFSPTMSVPPTIRLLHGGGRVLGYLRALKDTLKTQHYDLVHIHAPHLAICYILVRLLLLSRTLPPVVYTVHSSYPNYKLRNRLMALTAFALFDRIICCSQSSFDSFPSLYKWVAGKRLCVVRNGVDIERIERTIGDKTRPHEDGALRLAAVGRLLPVKNPFSILESFQTAADALDELTFIGIGSLRDQLVARSEEFGIRERVTFTGLLKRQQVYSRLLDTDLYISASWVEGLPIAVLEAMVCRCPVILSDIPPHREIAEGADFIPLVRPDDAAGFARQIKIFRNMSPAERASRGAKCRELVVKRFGLREMHQQYDRVYAQVLGKDKGGLESAAPSSF